MNGNFQEKRISADSDYGQQSSGIIMINLSIDQFVMSSYNEVLNTSPLGYYEYSN